MSATRIVDIASLPGAREADERAARIAVAPARPSSRRSPGSRSTTAGRGIPTAPELFRSLDPLAWELNGRNPVRQLEDLAPHALEAAGRDDAHERADRPARATSSRRPRAAGGTASRASTARSSFVCAEFGIHPSLPIYSGGLGRARGRHPQAGERPRAADDRRRAALPEGLLPAARRPDGAPARVLDADRPRAPADRAGASARTARRCG